MTQARPFPLNAWYAAAWSHEIKHELAARTICEKDVVLYRRRDGQVVALEDACWHRLLPLSMGRLKDDEVVCGYHGLVFNAGGVERELGGVANRNWDVATANAMCLAGGINRAVNLIPQKLIFQGGGAQEQRNALVCGNDVDDSRNLRVGEGFGCR